MPLSRLSSIQPSIASRLSEELSSASLPQSLLFHGPSYSGRMSAAIELAVHLTGAQDSYARLECPDIVIVPSRDVTLRIRAMRNLFERQRRGFLLDAMIHETRIALSPFHEVFYSGGEKEAFSAAGELSDVLYETPKEFDDRSIQEFLSRYDAALERFLSRRRRTGAFTIDQIRAIQAFLQQNASQAKVVILENIEDVTVGAMNSILKLLEEPPEGAYIILVSHDAGRILATILSRVRQYAFPQIPSPLQARLIRDVYRVQDQTSLHDFICASSGLDMTALEVKAEDFVHRVVTKRSICDGPSLGDLCSFLDQWDAYDIFLDKVVAIIEDGFLQDHIEMRRAQVMLDTLSSCRREATTFSQNRRTMMERIDRRLSAL